MNTRNRLAKVLFLCIASFAAVSPTVDAETGRRLALLIGNGDYKDGQPISGKANVMALKPVLEQIGFEAKVITDANLGTMNAELESFGARIAGASTVLFFYSGHGFQLKGESYLLPVGGSPQEDRSVPLQDVLDTLAHASGAVKLMILDACRSKAGIEKSAEGWAKPQATAEGIVQAFATLSGLDASSGKGFSPYTRALIKRFRQPGVNLKQFFTEVRSDVIEDSSRGDNPQFPTTEGLDRVKDEFLLSPPAHVEARVELADDDLIVLLNGKLALNHQTREVPLEEELRKELRKDLELKSGENELTILVSNQKTLRHGLAWERTSGWGYSLRLIGPDGRELTSAECGGQDPCFSAGEEVPFKDGPHHGKTFVVATAKLDVDPTSGMTPRVSLRNVKTDLWRNGETPFWAKDQGILYAVGLTKLPLGIEITGNIKQFFETIVKVMLRIRVNIPDPDKIYSVVRGNVALKEHVVYCMDSPEWHEIRKADFAASLEEARDGKPTPFDGFVQRLNKCIRKQAEKDPRIPVTGDEIRVWTAFEDWTKEPNPPGT